MKVTIPTIKEANYQFRIAFLIAVMSAIGMTELRATGRNASIRIPAINEGEPIINNMAIIFKD